ncbi:integral membrane sensor signal transduction histidine kinase [Paenibacillus curdlanolyticus YK9]|uniref:Heme sensor protein HssS n=1 Tax=Paenibacillus curdlanolyticus YK9 TaxID=717606 RepID=E0I779_9BACL|nr:HAMP domain-containing sensor histidine kinase [Paenibacillus curdlanolyticus]EFM11895.1 integral membrane sensor signal transduction histidine kinase [Paenibacillus curdlanolyticus YK9]
MRTLYVRIVIIFIAITLVSGLLSILGLNVLYWVKLRASSEASMMKSALEIRQLYEETEDLSQAEYLERMARTGFQIYAVNEEMERVSYGSPFRHIRLEEDMMRAVLNGATYDSHEAGGRLQPVTRLFENSVRNTVGLHVEKDGHDYAWFIRPDLERQIGDIRILVAWLLGGMFVLSLLLIPLASRYVVRPVVKLTAATRRLAGGSYDIQLDVSRKDELGQLARDFENMAASLRQLDAMRQQFVGNVSHEIQSPLTTIQGFAQALQEGETPEADKRRYIQLIGEESRRLSSLSHQLLTLASLDNEGQQLKTAPYRLDEQLRQVLIMNERQWSAKSLELDLQLSEVIIDGNEGLLHQVWLNLITNAIKFSRAGGRLAVRLHEASGESVVTIEDQGAGISPEALPHIFDRFYKADAARSRAERVGGSGLGLSIVHKIVLLHDGTVFAESEEGKWTRLTVRLPVGLEKRNA